MVKKFYILLFLLIGLSCYSCTEDKNDVVIMQDSINIQSDGNNKVSDKLDSARAIKEDNYLKNLEVKEKKKVKVEELNKEKNLPKEELAGFLPDTIAGFKQLPVSTGKTIESDNAITIYARKQFKDVNKRSILFDIFDYGKGNAVLNANIYETIPGDLDATANRYKTEDVKGFYYWLDQKPYGHIEVIVDNRFVIMVRLTGFKRDEEILKEFLNKINIKNIILSGKR